jgi:CheY-like chemotaxis protein
MSEDTTQALSKGRVLYIEDEPLLGRIFKLSIERAGYQVMLAETGRQGLEMHASTPFDIVAIDCPSSCNWNNWRPDLRGDPVHLVQYIKRRICGIASAGLPSFSV